MMCRIISGKYYDTWLAVQDEKRERMTKSLQSVYPRFASLQIQNLFGALYDLVVFEIV